MWALPAIDWQRVDARLSRDIDDSPIIDPAIEEDRLRLESDPMAFMCDGWAVLHSGARLAREWYVEALVAHLAAMDELKWLAVHMPPRTGKTIICSVLWQARLWTLNPSWPLLTSSFSDRRCETDARLMRELVRSPWFQARWPIRFAEDQNQKGRYNNTAGGYRYTVLYGSQGTGDGGRVLTLDDPQCGADMFSPADLAHDEEWLHNTWMSRRNEKTGPDEAWMLFVGQRLGWQDLMNSLRLAYPNRLHVLSLEARKTSVLVTTYWSRRDDGQFDAIDMPSSSSPLITDGRVTDPRQPGDLLTARLPDTEIDSTRPSVRDAQLQQRPRRVTSGRAQIYSFDRDQHVRSFAARMGQPTLIEACQLALRTGWQCSTSWDHGLNARREWGGIFFEHPTDNESWVVGVYVNQARTTPRQDALGMRALLDARGIPTHAVKNSVGDVGTMPSGHAGTPITINREMSTVLGADGFPILGFAINTPQKGSGSVETGVELINMCFGDLGQFYLDQSASALADPLEQWQGDEVEKDGADMFRYKAAQIAEKWQRRRSGASGSVAY